MELKEVVFVWLHVELPYPKREMVDLIQLLQCLMVDQPLQGMYPLASHMRMLEVF